MIGRRRLLRDLDQEMQDHIEQETQENIERGMPPDEARYAAVRKFGNLTLLQEDTRTVWCAIWLQQFWQDLRYGLRILRRNPAFTLTAVIAIALGVGSSTAVFSVVDRILFRPLPYSDPDRLVSVGMLAASADNNEFFMAPAYLHFKEHQTPFSNMASFGFTSGCDLAGKIPLRLQCASVDASYLPTFGIRPLAGRDFTPKEDLPHSAKVALLSFSLWKSRFAGDKSIIGHSLSIDGQPVTIIGILPQNFELFNLAHADLLIPSDLARSQTGRAVRAFARLKPGVTLEQAQAALQPLFAQTRKDVPPEFQPGLRLVVRSLKDREIAGVRTASWVLFAAVLLVLLIACANVSNLLLARAVKRRREMAVRFSLGPARTRLIRQALVESLALAAVGAIGGCLLAWGFLHVIVAIAPGDAMRLTQASIDGRVLLFAIAISVIAGVLFGLTPSLERPDPEMLSGGRSVTSSRFFARELLVSIQVAASLLLLAGTGLLLRTLWSLESVPLGMNTAHVLTAHLLLGKAETAAGIFSFTENLESKLNHLPGVSAAAISDSLPPSGGIRETPYSALNVAGHPSVHGGAVGWRYVTPQYFAALDIPILQGRAFDEQDRLPDGSAIILSQTLAARLFPHQNPIGKSMFESPNGSWHTVIGISADVKNSGLIDPEVPEYYLVRKRMADAVFGDGSTWRSINVVVRSPLKPDVVAREIRSAVTQLNPTLPVNIDSMQQRVATLTQRPRFSATLLGMFSGVALLLAAIGIYGVITFLVSQRTREIGIRMALGATPKAIQKLFLVYAARWTALGIAIGLLGSIWETRLLSAMLFQVNKGGEWNLLAVSSILFFVALLAAWLPSQRAAVIDPARTLREE